MKVIKLRLYRGKKLLYDENGKVENENQLIKLSYGSEWNNFREYIKAQGYCLIEFIGVNLVSEGTSKPASAEERQQIIDELKDSCIDKKTGAVVIKTKIFDPGKAKADSPKPGQPVDGDEKLTDPDAIKAYRAEMKKIADSNEIEYKVNTSSVALEEMLIEAGHLNVKKLS